VGRHRKSTVVQIYGSARYDHYAGSSQARTYERLRFGREYTNERSPDVGVKFDWNADENIVGGHWQLSSVFQVLFCAKSVL